MLMKLLPAIERIFNVTLHLLACVVLWGCLTGGAAWAQYSDDLKDIQHDIGDIHVFPGFHEPRPIGHLGEVDSVVDLRGFVPMSLSSKTAGGWLTNLRWYKIPTRKALLLLYFGTLSVSHVADDTTSLEKRFSKTSFLKESNVNAESKLWCKVAYNSAKDSAAIYQQIAGGSGLQGAEPTTIFLTPESAFVILNFKYIRALSENLTERPILRNFLHPLNREELDVGHRHPLGLQQQIPQLLIPPAAFDQHTDLPVHRFHDSEANQRPAVVHNAFDVFEQHVG